MSKLLGIVVLACSVALLGGCAGTQPKKPSAAAEQGVVTPGAVPSGLAPGAGVSGRELGGVAGGERGGASIEVGEPGSPLSQRVFYFDFDSAEVRPEYQTAISAHAAYLAQHPSAAVILEGHTDERGSREYNLALGERRAQAVRQLLLLQGASPSQVESVSYGEERPVALGHDESAWQLNRRVELVYRRP